MSPYRPLSADGLVGELAAGSVLLYMIARLAAPGLIEHLPTTLGTPGGLGGLGIMAFLTVWLLFWTIGGYAAMRELLRLLWSEDGVSWDSTGVTLDRRVGPFRSRRSLAAAEVREVRLHAHDRALVIGCGREVVEVTAL